MRRTTLLMVAIIMLAGCGKNEVQPKFEGVEENKNFLTQGMEALKNNDLKTAIADFDAAIQNDPANVENYLVLGQVYMKLQNYTKAIDTLTAGTKVDPKNGFLYYLNSMSKKLRGQPDDEIGAVEDAKKSFLCFQMAKDEEGIKQAVILLKSLEPQPETQPAEEAGK